MQAAKIVQIVVTAYQEGDLDTVLELTSDEVVFTNTAEPGTAPHCARVSNKHEFVTYLEEVAQAWDVERFQIAQLIESGDEVATRSHMEFVSKSTGRRVVSQGAHFWTVKDGKVLKIHEFYDTAEFAACK